MHPSCLQSITKYKYGAVSKHTINIKPGERVSFDVEPDEIGKWAFHCHLLFHMELGMFRVVSVVDPKAKAPA